ncbi:hypothetical protein BC829DRAFT_397257 [Chytridium lagenaria]|nr:hypothetical protein BC829DRAFT_397257 [Chytridium lagenaria]
MCTGLTPNSSVLATLSPASVDPKTSYVLVQPTLQIQDAAYPNIFAGGDVTSTDDNIVRLIKGDEKLKSRPHHVPTILLYLGLKNGATQGNIGKWTFTLGTMAWRWLRTPISEAAKV